MYQLILMIMAAVDDLEGDTALNFELTTGFLRWVKLHEKTLRDQVYQGNISI